MPTSCAARSLRRAFHATHVLPQAQALSRTVIGGGASVLDVDAALI
jgi:hypothetical protein